MNVVEVTEQKEMQSNILDLWITREFHTEIEQVFRMSINENNNKKL